MSTDPTHSTNQANGNLTAMDPMKGILWMLIYGLFISMMHVTIRHVSADMHPFEIAFFRNLFALIAIGPWFIKLGWSVLKTDRPGMMIARGGVNTLCMLGYFTAITIAPLAEVTALGFTAPIYTTTSATSARDAAAGGVDGAARPRRAGRRGQPGRCAEFGTRKWP